MFKTLESISMTILGCQCHSMQIFYGSKRNFIVFFVCLTMWPNAKIGICNKQNMVLNRAILLPIVQIVPVNWFPPSMRANISWISEDFCTKPTRLSLWNYLWLIRSLQQSSYVVFIWLKFLLYTDPLLSTYWPN